MNEMGIQCVYKTGITHMPMDLFAQMNFAVSSYL